MDTQTTPAATADLAAWTTRRYEAAQTTVEENRKRLTEAVAEGYDAVSLANRCVDLAAAEGEAMVYGQAAEALAAGATVQAVVTMLMGNLSTHVNHSEAQRAKHGAALVAFKRWMSHTM